MSLINVEIAPLMGHCVPHDRMHVITHVYAPQLISVIKKGPKIHPYSCAEEFEDQQD